MQKPTDIDAYHRQYPALADRLQQLRDAIASEAPAATECISYGMPTFKLSRNLVHYAAYERHIGFYPTPSAIEAFAAELSGLKTSKGAVQFPNNQPLPLELIRRMVRFRVAEESRRVPPNKC